MNIVNSTLQSEDIVTIPPAIHEGVKMRNVQKTSRQEIKENFEQVTHKLLQHNLLYLQHTEPNIRRLMEMPELQDLTLQSMDLPMYSTECKLHSSTAFAGDLRQLLIDRGGFLGNQISIRPNGVHINLYNSHFKIYIKQTNLAA